MPTLSASDYTQYLKFKSASVTPIRPAIQTQANVSTSQSLINANVLASQAAFVVTPATAFVITSSTTVTGALTNVITSVIGSSGLVYGTSQPHGLVDGDTVTITGLTQNTLTVDPNRTGVVAFINSTSFRFVVGGATGTGSGTGSITGRVYYTTSAAHELVVGDSATITGVTTFTASNASVLAVPSSTTFVLSSTTTGTAVTGQSGVLTFPRSYNQSMAIRGLARVIAPQVVQQRSTVDAKSTLSFSGTSGALSSSRVQQPGGLPTGFKNSQGTYTRLPQNAGWAQGGAENITSGPKRF